jgi:hypothetical protein
MQFNSNPQELLVAAYLVSINQVMVGKATVLFCVMIAWILGTSLWQVAASFNMLADALVITHQEMRPGNKYIVAAEKVAAAVIDLLIKASQSGK